MSEDDRAAKAARAKAMLKKRQQKKAADSTSATPGVVLVDPPRTFSPVPSENVEQDGRDSGEIFFKDASDTSWLSSLPRAASPVPPPPFSPPRVTTYAPLIGTTRGGAPDSVVPIFLRPSSDSDDKSLHDRCKALLKENADLTAEINRLHDFETAVRKMEALLGEKRRRVEQLQETLETLQRDSEIALQNERQTVTLLVNEKTHLSAELQKREHYESQAKAVEDLLETERMKADVFSDEVHKLQKDVQVLSERAQQSLTKEKALADRCKEQERQLQFATASASDSRKETESLQRKLRELEEQMQSDDRVERLENSLKHMQDRADELEFQLSKLKPTHMALKSERDTLETKYQESLAKESDRDTRISQLDEQLLQMRSHLADLSTERDELSQAKTNLQQQVEKNESAVQELQDKLAQTASAVSTNTRQLQTSQNDLRNALRRADDAEKTQKSLQAEGTELMRSLEEMRPKIVELTSAKLDLVEKVESLEHILRSRNSIIAQLESDLEESRDKYEQSEQVWKGKFASQEKRQMEAQGSSADLQKAYTEVQEELDSALVSLRSLEAQRTNQHQEASRRLEEIARFSSLSHTQGQELDALRQELEARQKAHDEERTLIDQAQDEIEELRTELNSRDNEIEYLRKSINSSTDAPHSLDDELLSSLRQQHALDLSAATAQARALEDTIYDKERANHVLQKQVNALEEQLLQLRSNYPGQRAFSPIPSRLSGRALESDPRRISMGSRKLGPPLSRSVFDHPISPETLHKRKVSLSMLKARIDSEVKPVLSQPPSRALSPVHSDTHSHPSSLVTAHLHRPQFLDETHVFWCHSCHGDLVIL